MAGKKKIEEPVKKVTTKTATKKAATKEEIVDSTAVELPINEEEEVHEEPEIEAVSPEEELMERIAARYYHISDSEIEIAAKIFQNTKENLQEKFADRNMNLIAAAAADAALAVMDDISKDAAWEERKKERKERREEKKEDRIRNRAARKARLGLKY